LKLLPDSSSQRAAAAYIKNLDTLCSAIAKSQGIQRTSPIEPIIDSFSTKNLGSLIWYTRPDCVFAAELRASLFKREKELLEKTGRDVLEEYLRYQRYGTSHLPALIDRPIQAIKRGYRSCLSGKKFSAAISAELSQLPPDKKEDYLVQLATRPGWFG
jgi:hypothetical protein